MAKTPVSYMGMHEPHGNRTCSSMLHAVLTADLHTHEEHAMCPCSHVSFVSLRPVSQDAHAGLDDEDEDDGPGTAAHDGGAGSAHAERGGSGAGPSGQAIDVKAKLAALAARKRKEKV